MSMFNTMFLKVVPPWTGVAPENFGGGYNAVIVNEMHYSHVWNDSHHTNLLNIKHQFSCYPPSRAIPAPGSGVRAFHINQVRPKWQRITHLWPSSQERRQDLGQGGRISPLTTEVKNQNKNGCLSRCDPISMGPRWGVKPPLTLPLGLASDWIRTRLFWNLVWSS